MRKNGAVQGLVMVILAGAALVLVLTGGYYLVSAVGAFLSWCYHSAFMGPRVLVGVTFALLICGPAAIKSVAERIGVARRDAARRRARLAGQRRA